MVNGEVLTKEQVDDIRRALRGESGGRSFARPDRVVADLLATLDAATAVIDQARNVSPKHCGATMVLAERVKNYDAARGASGSRPVFVIIHPSDRVLCWNNRDEEVWGGDKPVLFNSIEEARALIATRTAQYPDSDWPRADVGEYTPGAPRVHGTWRRV